MGTDDLRMETQIMIVMLVTMALAMGETQGQLDGTEKMLLEMQEMMTELTHQVEKAEQNLKMKKEELEREVSRMRDVPYLHQCGYTEKTSPVEDILTYDEIFYSSTNTEGGGLEGGVFTAPHPGTYTVAWSLNAENGAGDNDIMVVLRKNGEQIPESLHRSWLINEDTSSQADQGGRTILVGLDTSDTLDLFCFDCSATILYLNLCVSLTTPDT